VPVTPCTPGISARVPTRVEEAVDLLGVHVTPALDPAELERSLRQVVRDRLRIYAIFGAGWGVIQLGIFRVAHARTGYLPYAVDAGFVVACALAFAAARRALSSNITTGVGVALGVCQLAVHAAAVAGTGEQVYSFVAALVIAASGIMVLHTAWLVAFVVSGSVMMIASAPGDLRTPVLLFAAASTTSLVLHFVGRRYVLAIEALRQREARSRIALEDSLAETRRQLADRARAEAERATAERERLRLEEQLVQAQKMESLGTLAGGFAHDMNNVLSSILAGAELIREDAPEALHQDIDDLIASTQRGAELTRNLLGFARRGQYRHERLELGTLVTSMIRMLTRTVPKGVVFESTIVEPAPTIEGDPALFTQALINLCLNSVDAMRGVGRLSVSVGRVEVDRELGDRIGLTPGPFVSIAIADTGCGMSPQIIRRIFEPFFTTKGVGRGTGLGLAMVYGTVKSWAGAVDVDSTVGVGTRITMYLPAVETIDQARSRARRASVSRGSGTIMVVDDDPQIRRVARRILEGRGYRVREAANGAEALAAHDAHGPEISLVVLDMAMPVMGGAECFTALRARDPDLRVLLVSGYAIEEDARRCLADGAIGFLDKPYTVDVFSAAVAGAIRGGQIELPRAG